MKKTAIILILWALILCMFSVNVCAEETLTAPMVQYKLIDHDRIALRWDAVEGADGYYIYRTDVKTGKTFRYPSIVNKTENTIGSLSPDTEYIFSVAPIKKNDKVTVGKRSSGTKLITPKEWYYYSDYDIDYNRKKMTSYYYKTDYSNTKKEEINLGDIKAVDEIIYYDGWYYVIGDYAAITAEKNYPWINEYGSNHPKCVTRIKEDGTNKEILLKFYSTEGWYYSHQLTDDAIYIRSYHISQYETKRNSENQKIVKYYSYPEWCWIKKISLKTAQVHDILSARYCNWFYSYGEEIYYEYDNNMKLTNDNNGHDIFVSDWYDYQKNEKIAPSDDYLFYCKINENSQKNKCIAKYHNNDIINKATINNDICILEGTHTIYIMSTNNKKRIKLYESTDYVGNAYIVNEYIYFTESKYSNGNYDFQYCRIKADGSDLVKQDKPFEWYY